MSSAVSTAIWHKLLSVDEAQRLMANDVDPLVGGFLDVVNGFATPATYVAHLRGAASYYEALVLSYDGSSFAPEKTALLPAGCRRGTND